MLPGIEYSPIKNYFFFLENIPNYWCTLQFIAGTQKKYVFIETFRAWTMLDCKSMTANFVLSVSVFSVHILVFLIWYFFSVALFSCLLSPTPPLHQKVKERRKKDFYITNYSWYSGTKIMRQQREIGEKTKRCKHIMRRDSCSEHRVRLSVKAITITHIRHIHYWKKKIENRWFYIAMTNIECEATGESPPSPYLRA